MKTYEELTRLGRIRRLRKIAEIALQEYSLSEATLKFQHYQGNVIFRVDVPEHSDIVETGPFMANRFNLRILTISDMDTILGELTWLDALRQEAGLPVPEPVPTLDGKLLTKISTPGVPHGKVVSLMRWINGKHLSNRFRPAHLKALGRLVAKLHRFAAGWQPPDGFSRFHWDWGGLFGKNGILCGHSTEELVASLPKRFRTPYETVSQEVQSVMEEFGKGPDAYGMIHADLYPDNILFKDDAPRIIDFEGCGFGYWMYDIGVALSQWAWTEEWSQMLDSFMEGYMEIRPIEDRQLKHLDLFIAAQYAVMVLWGSMFIKNDPAMKSEHEKWLQKEGNRLLCYFERKDLRKAETDYLAK
jgi:Ser/Thr protein kinase RdoA (MazF antagonist)